MAELTDEERRRLATVLLALHAWWGWPYRLTEFALEAWRLMDDGSYHSVVVYFDAWARYTESGRRRARL